MKRILFLLCALAAYAIPNAQLFQATIKPGRLEGTVAVYIKPDNTVTGKMQALQLSLIVPKSVAPLSRPQVQMLHSFPGTIFRGGPNMTDWAQPLLSVENTNDNKDSFWVYSFNGVILDKENTFAAGHEYKMLEVKFNGSADLYGKTVKLAQLVDGGEHGDAPGRYNFSVMVNGIDMTNLQQQFYGNATNEGIGYYGFSYAEAKLPKARAAKPAPVLTLNAKALDETVNVDWNIENGSSTHYYDVERSVDGKTFTAIATVKPNGEEDYADYTLHDNLQGVPATANELYYRIKRLNTFGKIQYSDVKSVGLLATRLISVFPNPASTNVNIVFQQAYAGKVSIFITDQNGKSVYQKALPSAVAGQNISIPVAQYAKGLYEVTVNSGNFSGSKKIVIQ